jgi:putative GTP pyrophosphokinase
VPSELLDSLKDAADSASELDSRMARLHREVHGAPQVSPARHSRAMDV